MVRPVYYRAVLRVNNPVKIKGKLLSQGIKTIIPIEDWELLDNGSEYKNACNLTQTTLSLPIYPLLTNREVANIVNQLNRVIK